jgi:hypothetical protein
MLISINTASTRPIKHTKNIDKAENKASAHIKKIVIRIHTVKDMYTKENTKEAKEIKNSDRKSTIFMTNKAVS